MIEWYPLTLDNWLRWAVAGVFVLIDIVIFVLYLNYITEKNLFKAAYDFIKKIWTKI